MTGQMITFDTSSAQASGYLASPDGGTGPGVVVLHAWWGLTEPFKGVCDRLAEAGFVALAPDLYRGKTATTVEEAEALAQSLNPESERVSGDIAGAMRYLREHADGSTYALIGFSLGGAYALDTSVSAADEVAAVVIFYATYTGLEFSRARAAYQFHFAESDPWEPEESVAAMKESLQSAGKAATYYTYPGTSHWFFEENQPSAYNADAAARAWERTLAFLNEQLRQG